MDRSTVPAVPGERDQADGMAVCEGGAPLRPSSPLVLFMPDWRNGNPYLDLLASGIETQGCHVRIAHFPRATLPLRAAVRRHPEVRLIHLHWVNDYLSRMCWARNGVIARLHLVRILLDVLMVRMSGVKVFWTVHNRVSHDSPNAGRELMGRRWLARVVNRLIFHSGPARDEVEKFWGGRFGWRAVVVPHGSYVGLYAPDPGRAAELRSRFNLADDDVVVLFFGAIRRYKGLLSLLEAFRQTTDPRLKLIVAGKPRTPDLAQEIEEAAAQDPRIKALLGFVPEGDVHPLYSLCHVAAVPFERTLTSGSAVLAMSMGKALLLPDDARVIGLPQWEGTVFFGKEQGLKDALERLPTCDLDNMGATNLQSAVSLTWDRIGSMTVASYGFGCSDTVLMEQKCR